MSRPPLRTEPRLRLMEPERLMRPASAWLIWISIVVAGLVSLLPWRLWLGAPDILLLVIAIWCMAEPNRVGMLTAFVFGLFMDVHDAVVLGSHTLVYVMVAYGAVVLRRRLQRFDLISQAFHMLPVFFLAELVSQCAQAWLAGRWPGWAWALGSVLTAALWPIAAWLLSFPQHGAEDGQSVAP